MEAHLASTQPTQVNKITTSREICSGPHDTQYCMKNPELSIVEYASSCTDEAGDRMVGVLPIDTVKNPKLNVNTTTLVCLLVLNQQLTPNAHLTPPLQSMSVKTFPRRQAIPNTSLLQTRMRIWNRTNQESKSNLEENSRFTFLTYRSSFIQGEVSTKMEDPGLFTLPCRLGDSKPFDTLADLGSCVNIIPLYLFKKLNIGLLEETDHIFGLADGTKSYPVGIVKDVEVRIGKLKLLNDFYVIDMKKDPETPLLVGTGFLAIANARMVSKVPGPEYTIKFMLNTQEFIYTVDMFRDILYLPVETPKNLFVALVNIETIKAFMNRVDYQGVVDKVSAFYMKNLAQSWQTMFKVFNRCLTTRTSRHDQTKINNLQMFHAVINQTNVDYVALLWWDFMNNTFLKGLKRIINSMKDDIPLEIRDTDDFKEYEMVFMNVDVPMNQPQPVVSTQGTHRQQKVVEGEKDDDDSEDRLEPGSHKDNPEHVDDDDDKDAEKVDEEEGGEMGSLETRTEEMQTPIPTKLRSPRTILSLDKNITQELTDIVPLPTTTTSNTSHSK
ncbi:MAK10-like protein [Tanacetum coccineum]